MCRGVNRLRISKLYVIKLAKCNSMLLYTKESSPFPWIPLFLRLTSSTPTDAPAVKRTTRLLDKYLSPGATFYEKTASTGCFLRAKALRWSESGANFPTTLSRAFAPLEIYNAVRRVLPLPGRSKTEQRALRSTAP